MPPAITSIIISIFRPPLKPRSHHEQPRERERAAKGEAMESSSEAECAASIPKPCHNPDSDPSRAKKKKKKKKAQLRAEGAAAGTMGLEDAWKAAWPRKTRPPAGGGVLLEGYVDVAEGASRGGPDGCGDGVGRTRSLTNDDLDELKGCLDLGFGFNYEEIPELCGTLPALELCYSMSRSMEAAAAAEPCAQPPVANWKISSPGDHPEEIKARLKYWAQAVACTVRLCS